jgi:hypothetical protein
MINSPTEDAPTSLPPPPETDSSNSSCHATLARFLVVYQIQPMNFVSKLSYYLDPDYPRHPLIKGDRKRN